VPPKRHALARSCSCQHTEHTHTQPIHSTHTDTRTHTHCVRPRRQRRFWSIRQQRQRCIAAKVCHRERCIGRIRPPLRSSQLASPTHSLSLSHVHISHICTHTSHTHANHARTQRLRSRVATSTTVRMSKRHSPYAAQQRERRASNHHRHGSQSALLTDVAEFGKARVQSGKSGKQSFKRLTGKLENQRTMAMSVRTAAALAVAMCLSTSNAATVLPSKPQLEWQLNDTGCFVHYNMVSCECVCLCSLTLYSCGCIGKWLTRHHHVQLGDTATLALCCAGSARAFPGSSLTELIFS
jgi:hypothetical protein